MKILQTILLALTGILVAATPAEAARKPLYKDASKTPEERVADLLPRMTLEEKVAQLKCIWNNRMTLYTEDGQIDKAKWDAAFKNGLGEWARMSEDKSSMKNFLHSFSPREAAQLYNQVQRYFLEETRLGIPVMVHEEGLHGAQSKDATHFPMPIGLASSWDEGLFTEIYTIVAREIRAKGGHEVLAPVVDITRDPRWGRTEETMGEDPYLNGRLGIAQVKAYQGNVVDGKIDRDHVGATLKHFGVHGASEGGSNTGPSFVDEITTLDVFLRPFEMCLEEAKPFNVMIGYNDVWGQPVHGNARMIQGILRGKYGYTGLTVSDYGGVGNLHEADHLAPNPKEAAYQGFTAGVDIELPEGATYDYLVELVNEGRIPQKKIDEAVSRILLEKFRLGLFDNPYIDPEASEKIVGNAEARALAYKAACESVILLENKGNVLPLDENKVKTLAVIGPNAKEVHLGGYSSTPRQTVSVYDALVERYGDKMNILYAEGCKITYRPARDNDPSVPSFIPDHYLDSSEEATPEINAPLIEEAVKIARGADAIILCLGSNESIAREGTGTFMPGDTPSLELLGGQNELARRIGELGIPTVALVITGTTNNVAPLAASVPAILQCWYLGQEGGYAMADAVFGKFNPSGKLTISIPRGAGYVPAYYNYKRTSRRGYTLKRQISALYPFGYGLSYTTYSYSAPRLSAPEMTADGTLQVSVDVTNTGGREGDEIVQMYLADDYCSVSRAVKELKGFQRIHLAPGQTRTVTFTIDRSLLEFYNADLEKVVEPGTFTVTVGPSSQEGGSVQFTLK